ERRPLPALALTGDAVAMTALSNDYSYEDAFARQTEGLMQSGDILIGLSTSGNSENVYRALIKAREVGGKTIALLGKAGGKIKDISDLSIIVPSDNTARIQESHILIGHIICEIVEEMF
ncbi:MAG: SIS domain-containing protein, partial [Pseudobutyrivibrio sp.]|nr:SIS domain-containing protein [Pseudobutyrivibrio sp.]